LPLAWLYDIAQFECAIENKLPILVTKNRVIFNLKGNNQSKTEEM